MDQVDSGNRSAAPSGARPSLFASGKSPTPDGPRQPQAISILSSLDKNGGRKPLGSTTGLPTWFTIAVGSLLGITIGAAIVMSFTRDANVTRHAPVQPTLAVRAEAPQQSSEPPATAAPIASVAAPAADVQAAATIENAPPAASVPATQIAASPQSAAADTDMKIGATSAEPAAPATGETRGGVRSAAATTAATENAPTSGARASATASVDTSAAKTANAKKVKAKDGKPESTAATVVPADRDASLLAALVAYGEGRPAADINARAAPIVTKSAEPRPAGSTQTLAQAGGQFDPRRDVVLRESTVSTAELVRRCRTLGFFEGLLCRMRVCSNLWGKDTACPQSAAPVERGTP